MSRPTVVTAAAAHARTPTAATSAAAKTNGSAVAVVVLLNPNPPPPSRAPASVVAAVDLFCGAGGLSEGLRQAGFDVVAAGDHDPDACATYRLNFPEATLVEGDLTARTDRRRLVRQVSQR